MILLDALCELLKFFASQGSKTSTGDGLPAASGKEQHLDQMTKFVDMKDYDLSRNEPSYNAFHG